MATDTFQDVVQSPAMRRRAQFEDFRFAIGVGTSWHVVSIRSGTVSLTETRHEPREDCAFTLCAEPAAWEEFARPFPRPGYHDVVAMVECGHASLQGDLLPFFRNPFLVRHAIARAFAKDWS